MESTTRVLIPIGHLLGSICYGDTPESIRFDVRIGSSDIDLSLPEFIMWSSAHGAPEVVREQAWTTEAAQRAAADAGVDDVASATEQLLSKGLLREVALGTDDVLRFAAEHQVFPLLLGLGNTLEDPTGFRIGTSAAAAAVVSLPVYSIWSRAHLEASLLAACTLLASTQLEHGAAEIVDGFLRVAHNVLAVNGLYFDLVNGVTAP
jgi:hypothetical protein